MSNSPLSWTILHNDNSLLPTHLHSHTPGEAGGGGKLSFAMLSGSSSDPGYFQLKERASSKPLLISALNWHYAQTHLCLLLRHKSAEPQKNVYEHVPLQEIKTGEQGNPKPTQVAYNTGTPTWINRRKWQPHPRELQWLPSTGRRCWGGVKTKARRCAEGR